MSVSKDSINTADMEFETNLIVIYSVHQIVIRMHRGMYVPKEYSCAQREYPWSGSPFTLAPVPVTVWVWIGFAVSEMHASS